MLVVIAEFVSSADLIKDWEQTASLKVRFWNELLDVVPSANLLVLVLRQMEDLFSGWLFFVKIPRLQVQNIT